MKILLASHVFPPSVGGLEAVSFMLAQEFARAGHTVKVATQTPSGKASEAVSFTVVRRPSATQLLLLVRWADVVFHNNLSLRTAWPLALIHRPWVVSHHIWIPRGINVIAIKGWVKRLVLARATGVAVSDAIARDLATPCEVVPNPYDSETFRTFEGVEQLQELVFVGRFVQDKGLPVLLHALKRLREHGLRLKLTVVGSGPEESAWRNLVIKLDLSEQVAFTGVKRGRELAQILNEHRVLVIPSLWDEPFGIVALEGMACGCVVVGSAGGGLKAAIGPAGIIFPNGDVGALVDSLKAALSDSVLATHCRAAAPAHLKAHMPASVAQRYLDIFSRAIAKSKSC